MELRQTGTHALRVTQTRLKDVSVLRERHISLGKEKGYVQMDIFTDYAKIEEEKKVEKREKNMQKAVLGIKKKFGKNAILKGMNLQEGATAKDRNEQIGGHKA